MDRHEFQEWAADFRKRFPTTGDWLYSLPEGTRDVWFEDCFKQFELRDCLAVNLQLMQEGELEAWQRERLPGIFIRRVPLLNYARKQRQREHEARKAEAKRRSRVPHRGKVGKLFTGAFTPNMLKCHLHVISAMDAYREKYGAPLNDEAIAAKVEEAFDQFDTLPDDDEDLPRLKCVDCRDSGLVSYIDEENGNRYAGVCECSAGREAAERWRQAKRPIGRAIVASQANSGAVEWDVP